MIWRKPAQTPEGETNAKRVLVIQLGGVGSFIQALAAAKRIREEHIGARITLLTTEATKELAEKAPYFDTVEADGKPTEPQAITAKAFPRCTWNRSAITTAQTVGPINVPAMPRSAHRAHHETIPRVASPSSASALQ